MVRRWCAFSILALAFVAKGGGARAAENPSGIAELPAVEWSVPESSATGHRVGDTVRITLENLPEALRSQGSVSIRVPEGASALSELGFFIPPGAYALSADGKLELEISFVKPGKLTLPVLLLSPGQEGAKPLARTGVLNFEIASTLDPKSQEPPEPAPPAPPVSMRFPWLAILPWVLLGVLGLGLAIYFLVRYSRSRRKPEFSVERPEIVLPEDEEALAVFRKLEAEELWRKSRHKEHYFGISDALKKYIERRYGFDAREGTAREILEKLEFCGASPETRVSLKTLFEKLDWVKFTDHLPADSDSVEVLRVAAEWVTITRRPKAQPVQESSPTHAVS